LEYAVIVDLETTGIVPEDDEIIEIGLLEFCHESFQNPSITRVYSGLSEPTSPLTDIIKKITGLDDKVLQGQKIDWDFVYEIMARSEVIIAHNADFDRGFLERSCSYKKPKGRWACSQSHIDWQALFFKSKALNYLACDHGFVNPFAHRAMFDCATTFRLISNHLSELYRTSLLKQFEVAALGAPYEVKDTLKARGYRWDPARRVWAKRIFENHLKEERDFLSVEIYRGPSRHSEAAIL
jgi:DNA polymerase-3 subunit epsilon